MAGQKEEDVSNIQRQRTPGEIAAYEMGLQLFNDTKKTHKRRREIRVNERTGETVLIEEETITTEERLF